MVKRRKKTPRQKIIDRLDALWRKIDSETQVCEVCATLPPEEQVRHSKIDNHHIIGRGNKLLRWDLRNRCKLCSRHHTLGNPCAEKNQDGWFLNRFSDEDWMGKNRPEDKKYLLEREHQTKKWSMFELRELEKHMKELLKNPKAGEYFDAVVDALS